MHLRIAAHADSWYGTAPFWMPVRSPFASPAIPAFCRRRLGLFIPKIITIMQKIIYTRIRALLRTAPSPVANILVCLSALARDDLTLGLAQGRHGRSRDSSSLRFFAVRRGGGLWYALNSRFSDFVSNPIISEVMDIVNLYAIDPGVGAAPESSSVPCRPRTP